MSNSLHSGGVLGLWSCEDADKTWMSTRRRFAMRRLVMRRLALILFALAFLALPAMADDSPIAGATTPGLQPGDPFGEEITLPERQILSVAGTATWEDGFNALQKALRTVTAEIAARKLAATGPATVIYRRADDAGFDFEAGIPVSDASAASGDATSGEPRLRPVPAGRALRFTHRGSFDVMDATYESMTNFLDDKRIDVRDLFVEEYLTDPLTTPATELRVYIYVFPN